MLNPFFIQGTSGEQGLVQDLINEQLKMYGIEVYFLPRKILNKGGVMRDAIYSKFDNAFPIEAYLVNYEGFDNNSVLMSKFGVRIQDEMNLIISKERFDDYIAALMQTTDGFASYSRPLEGDLIYIPLSDSLMEIKYVENRKPFYQLQKNYVYDLRCELFEYEDEEISTGNPEVDYQLKDIGYGAELTLSGLGITATAYTGLVVGGVQYVDILNGGYRYSSAPNLVVDSPTSGYRSIIVGVMTQSRGLTAAKSLDKIYIENPGYGYTQSPSVSFYGGNGYGASLKVAISTSGSVGMVTMTYGGTGYTTEPTVTFSAPEVAAGTTATARAFLDANGGISTVRIINAGSGYLSNPTITISAGSTIASGNFIVGENVSGSISGAFGIVKNWNSDTKVLKVTGLGTDFVDGDIVVGAASSAIYTLRVFKDYELQEPAYEFNDLIEQEADQIVDFTEINPFGEV